MIFKRAVAKLRAQDWMAIVIEFGIVVAGVFVGIWVANWNQQRIEVAQTRHMLRNMREELGPSMQLMEDFQNYFAITRRYAVTAFAGWRGDPAVSDRDFVIAAYQASQIRLLAVNGQSWSQALGVDRVPTIEDKALRQVVSQLLSFDYPGVNQELFTDYRREIREEMPEDAQEAIRRDCGNRGTPDGHVVLPEPCDLKLPDDRIAAAARALRAQPELVKKLRWHQSAVTNFMANTQGILAVEKEAYDRIGATR